MTRLECGDPTARANVQRGDELGRIADRFNLMAAQLEKASVEREALIEEIQGLNAGLQERIDAALAELQGKNRELENLLRRIALLREELGQQERLAVAGQLTAAFAHEVGTPLNLVNSHLQLLMAQGDLSEKTRERLGTIQTQITRVGDIVRKLLGNTRRPEIHPEPILLADLVADLQRLWGPTLANHRIVFEQEAPDGCLLLVDRKQMEQLFINLVNNAVDAMPQGGRIRLRIAKDDRASEAKPRWEIGLEDDGTRHSGGPAAEGLQAHVHHQARGSGDGPGALHLPRDRPRPRRGDPHREPRRPGDHDPLHAARCLDPRGAWKGERKRPGSSRAFRQTVRGPFRAWGPRRA